MKIFSYNPPKLKPSTKRTKVKDEQGNVVCWFERVYPNVIAKMCNYVFGIDWSAQIQVYSADGHPVFQCNKKTPWLGRPEYSVQRSDTQDVFRVTYKSWQKVAPEFKVTYQDQEYVIKKDMFDWAKFMHSGKELARWRMKTTEGFKVRLEIEEASPIQEPEFFVALFHSIFLIGD
ncbi:MULTISPECIES: hypothetical protein [Paenibacillus]|uniref:tubby C-terminal domain-like protein n=1 Tax=Paenibacillus TaxID=44249 RepID=UPI00203E2A72|nr:hypothetical protein [Paenibacillus lactis]MCM3493798.1 hypothetical protein [Paenibacillus lactis]